MCVMQLVGFYIHRLLHWWTSVRHSDTVDCVQWLDATEGTSLKKMTHKSHIMNLTCDSSKTCPVRVWGWDIIHMTSAQQFQQVLFQLPCYAGFFFWLGNKCQCSNFAENSLRLLCLFGNVCVTALTFGSLKTDPLIQVWKVWPSRGPRWSDCLIIYWQLACRWDSPG